MQPHQLELLPLAGPQPEGFKYQSELFSPANEEVLIQEISRLELREFEFQGYRGKRRVASFGLHYDFADGKLKPAEPMPPFLVPFQSLAASFAGLELSALPHVLVTEYSVGAGIGWHKDRSVFDDVIGLSCGAPCRFRLRRRIGEKWERAAVEVQPRSAYLLRGPARNEWEHSIPPSEGQRYSLTFRSLASSRNKRAR